MALIDTNAISGSYSALAAGGSVVKGEYLTRPNGMSGNPSRTTVDANGDVWVGNRNEGSGGLGSITKISSSATGSTSSGTWNGSTFNRLDWTNAGSADSNGGVSTAADSAILKYIRTEGANVRHVSVDKNNNVWAGGGPLEAADRVFQLYNGTTGAIVNTAFGASVPNNGTGGYGGLVDGNGIVWSAGLYANTLTRFDPTTGARMTVDQGGRYSYGLGIDNSGNLWNATWENNTLDKINSNGTLAASYNLASFGTGLRGVAVTGDNDVWVASSYGNRVIRVNNDGSVQGTVDVGVTPTGVAVDSNGKVWVTNFSSNSVMRIDPTQGTAGSVDLTIDLGPGANPYNYSDMTGTVLKGSTSPSGSWTSQVLDGGPAGAKWAELYFNQQAEGAVPNGTGLQIQVRVADSEGGLGAASWIDVANSGDDLGLTSRYMQVRATLTRLGGTDGTPVLSDMQINYAPVPEPGTWAMMLGGLGLLGAMARRRRN